MGRQKKVKSLEVKEKIEVPMTEENKFENIQQEIDAARVELENTKREIEEKKHELKLMANREISEDEKKIIEKQVSRINSSETLKSKIEAQRKHDSEMITGKFMNRRAPGQPAKLTYIKYDTDPVKWYELQDGKVYTIPRGFAEQINEHYHTPHFIQKQGEMDPNRPSSAIHDVDTSNKKYAFVPTTF